MVHTDLAIEAADGGPRLVVQLPAQGVVKSLELPGFFGSISIVKPLLPGCPLSACIQSGVDGQVVCVLKVD